MREKRGEAKGGAGPAGPRAKWTSGGPPSPVSLTDLGSAFPWPLLRLLLNVTGTAERLGQEAPSIPRGTLQARAQRSMPTAGKARFLGRSREHSASQSPVYSN